MKNILHLLFAFFLISCYQTKKINKQNNFKNYKKVKTHRFFINCSKGNFNLKKIILEHDTINLKTDNLCKIFKSKILNNNKVELNVILDLHKQKIIPRSFLFSVIDTNGISIEKRNGFFKSIPFLNPNKSLEDYKKTILYKVSHLNFELDSITNNLNNQKLIVQYSLFNP